MNAAARISAQVSSSLALSLVLLGNAGAAPTTTVFAPTVQLSGSTLQLNGKGTRHRAVFKVYEMALYLPRKAKNAEEVLSQAGPKQIDFTAAKIVEGKTQSHPPAQLHQLRHLNEVLHGAGFEDFQFKVLRLGAGMS